MAPVVCCSLEITAVVPLFLPVTARSNALAGLLDWANRGLAEYHPNKTLSETTRKCDSVHDTEISSRNQREQFQTLTVGALHDAPAEHASRG